MAISEASGARSADRSNATQSAERSATTTERSSQEVGRTLAEDLRTIDPSCVCAEAARVASLDPVRDGFETVGSRTHTVRPGDTMTHIARDHGVSLAALVEANPQVRNPDLIYPGEQLAVPSGGATGWSPNLPATLAEVAPGEVLARGSRGAAVADLQRRLNELGYASGPVDGLFGPITQGAVRRFQLQNGLNTTGRVDAATAQALRAPDAQRYAPEMGDVPRLEVYPPGSPEQIALFEEAARRIGAPEAWARDPGLINILTRESGGRVGIPNYTYGARARDPAQWGGIHEELRNGQITARSSATGLGQLLLRNVDRYYPSGRAGIGDPVEEAAGMLAYIRDRYGDPATAWRLYGTRHEGY